MIKDSYFIIFYSQIWLNLPRNDHHLFLHLPLHDTHFGYKQKFLKYTWYGFIRCWNLEMLLLMQIMRYFDCGKSHLHYLQVQRYVTRDSWSRLHCWSPWMLIWLNALKPLVYISMCDIDPMDFDLLPRWIHFLCVIDDNLLCYFSIQLNCIVCTVAWELNSWISNMCGFHVRCGTFGPCASNRRLIVRLSVG